MLRKVKPIAMKERISMVFIGKGQIDVLDGSFVVVDAKGVRKHIPVGSVACIMLEPGTRVSHAAAVLAARVGTLLVWVGEAGVRLYSAGQPGGARSDKLLYQAKLALDESARLKIVRKMFAFRFNEEAPQKRSVEQLRRLEGARVRALYKVLSQQYGVKWYGRNYDHTEWESGDIPNRCLSSATSCLYGVCEAAILAAGYAPAIGFVHTGKPQSFVYDIADLYKFETVVPAAFKIAAQKPDNPEQAVRHACRDMFRKTKLLKKIIPDIEDILAAGEKSITKDQGVVAPAIVNEKGIGDDGHRS
ncbi:type I-E CRISPR-associated endonuclease Cas1e [Halodesulfovibrio sp.]|jgi:CRISPR-associated protein Cas1|uniref:type I-E CRISPR-associated endonuclease Cas1e n=1 Tax=Halodesulfovibrio sp. TaxID=1912772 RepID=UPI0025EAACAA|nr:type I-E CRISPR-associated endonuclease Cas1e [Halodesulfovibrio sp.]MCT4533710.1 type I-E CRISPR-associated endonuclease Cas1e [Halodesulfovibrio sp.]